MPRVCTICSAPHVAELDQAVVSGQPIRSIAKRYSVSPSALQRHSSACLPAALVKAQEEEDKARGLDVAELLQAVYQDANEIRLAAKARGDEPTVLKAGDRILKHATLQARLDGELQENGPQGGWEPLYRKLKAEMMTALASYPEAKRVTFEVLLRFEAEARV